MIFLNIVLTKIVPLKSEREKEMKKVIILGMLTILMITVMTGCEVKEAYLFNQLIHPPDLSLSEKQEIQAKEVERQKIEAEDSDMGVPILVLRF